MRIALPCLAVAALATGCAAGAVSPDAGSGGTDASALDGGADATQSEGSADAGSPSDATADATPDAEAATGEEPDACSPSAETCNLADDDCNGECDDILGCRVGVDRSYDSTTGQHFYTTTDSEASCCGYTIEQQYAFYLYAAQQPGLLPFYRCRTATGHLYTTDASCDGATLEGTLGYIATSAVCGAVPLYALSDATSGDHLYTTSAAEVTSAEAGGYVSEGIAGYVWTTPED